MMGKVEIEEFQATNKGHQETQTRNSQSKRDLRNSFEPPTTSTRCVRESCKSSLVSDIERSKELVILILISDNN